MLLVPKLAFDLLSDAEEAYKEIGKFSDETLQVLYDVFNNTFSKAVEFLETGEALQYETAKGTRRLLKVSDKHELYMLFPDINFCYCPVFKHQVLKQQKLITCKHVLVAKLAKIQNIIRSEVMTDSQLVDLLNETIEYVRN